MDFNRRKESTDRTGGFLIWVVALKRFKSDTGTLKAGESNAGIKINRRRAGRDIKA